MKPILFLVLVVSFTAPKAQTNNQLINSGDLLEQGGKLYDDGKYKAAIEIFKKVPRSDTNYSRVLVALASATFSDSDYNGSIQYARLGLKLFPEGFTDWYNQEGNTLVEAGKKTEAMACYDSVLQRNPYAYVVWFNKGLCFFKMEKYPEAAACFKKTLLIYPFYTSAHYYLGKIYLKNGNLPAALYCFTTNLAINPDNRYRDNSVSALSSIANVKDEVATLAANAKPGGEDNFDLQQEILLGKIALDKQYKLQTDVEDPITRQLQVLFEKTDYNKNDDGFCMQFYVPFYKKIYNEGGFNTLVNFMFSGLNIKTVTEFNKKRKKEIEDYKVEAGAYLDSIKVTEVLNMGERAAAQVHYYFENGYMVGKGAWRNVSGKQTFYGPWEFYYNNGQLKSKGNFTDHESKDGEWVFYYKNGQLKEHSILADDSLSGKSTTWFDTMALLGIISCGVVSKLCTRTVQLMPTFK